jgi:hypothetical protein
MRDIEKAEAHQPGKDDKEHGKRVQFDVKLQRTDVLFPSLQPLPQAGTQGQLSHLRPAFARSQLRRGNRAKIQSFS